MGQHKNMESIMRNILFIALLVLTSSIYGQKIEPIDDGDSLVWVQSNINKSFVKGNDIYDIVNYGAVGDDDTDNTTAIQEAIDAAAVDGGTVLIPIGIFKTNALTSYHNVTINGLGRNSVLKSNSAEPLITIEYEDYGNGYERTPQRLINEIYLNGDSIGTIGLNTIRMYHFRITGLKVQHFTESGIFNNGSLIGEFDACAVLYCPIGIRDSTQYPPLSDSDELIIHNSLIEHCTKYGVRHIGGSQLSITDSHFRFNGTSADSLTGGVFVSDPNGSQLAAARNEGMIPLLYMNNCWYESYSGVGITIDSARDVNQMCVVSNTQFKYSSASDVHTSIQMYDSEHGSNTFSKLVLYNNNFQDNKAIIADGDSTIVIDVNSYIRGSYTLRGGATYTSLIDFYGNFNPPSGTTPTDESTAQGWATIMVDDVEYRIKLYQ